MCWSDDIFVYVSRLELRLCGRYANPNTATAGALGGRLAGPFVSKGRP